MRSHTIKTLPDKNVYLVRYYRNLIRSCKIDIRKAMTHFFDNIFIRSYTKKNLKCGMFFILKTIQSCFQATAKKLLHAALKLSEQQREKYLILSFETYKIL